MCIYSLTMNNSKPNFITMDQSSTATGPLQ